MQGALSKLRTWELDRKQEDIRGWPLRDAQAHVLGNVGELIVDTDSEHVTEIVLSDGRRYSAHDIVIGDRELQLGGNGSSPAETARLGSSASKASSASAVAEAGKIGKEKLEQTGDREPATIATDPGDLMIPIVNEEVEIGKRRIEAGGMRVTTRTVEKPFDRDVNLYEERVQVERKRVDRSLSAAEANEKLHDASIEVHAKAERPVVQRRTHVIEEVVLKKQASDHVERLSDSVRQTEAEIVELSNGQPRNQKGS